jgi:hypothetical protein
MADRGSNTVTWKGSVLLQRPSFFVLNDFMADVLDRATDLLGFRVALRLISVDPANSSTSGEPPRSHLLAFQSPQTSILFFNLLLPFNLLRLQYYTSSIYCFPSISSDFDLILLQSVASLRSP